MGSSAAGSARSFGKDARLRKRHEFLRVQRRGRKVHTRHFVILSMERREPEAGARVGFSVSRKVGNAVVRNRLRRRLREVARLHRERMRPGRDWVFIAKAGAGELGHAELAREILAAVGG